MNTLLWKRPSIKVLTSLLLLMPLSFNYAGFFPEVVVHEAKIQGTFFQLLTSHANWTPKQWEELFAQLKKFHVKQLILQWSVHDRTAFYPSATQASVSVSKTPLSTILDYADKARIQVWVGLIEDPQFWKKTTFPASENATYFQDLLKRSITTAQEIKPLLTNHSSFQGWYITQEIDDLNWRTPKAQNVVFDYLSGISSFLHALTPNADIAVSGFANTGTDPQFLETFWKTLLQKVPYIQHVFFQDSIGAHKLTLDNVSPYLKAMQNATKAQSKTLEVIVEIFDQKGGEPVNNGNFQAVPAPAERIIQQIKIAAPYSENLIAFSMPEYMFSETEAAKTLYKDYSEKIIK